MFALTITLIGLKGTVATVMMLLPLLAMTIRRPPAHCLLFASSGAASPASEGPGLAGFALQGFAPKITVRVALGLLQQGLIGLSRVVLGSRYSCKIKVRCVFCMTARLASHEWDVISVTERTVVRKPPFPSFPFPHSI